MKKRTIIGLVATAIIIPTTIWAASTFYKSGTVTRTLIDSGDNYGMCMIQLSTTIGGGCSSSWVSLDCEGKYLTKGMGDRMLNVAMIAQTMKKKVSIKVDPSKKFGGYCVATRIDLLN